MRPHLAVNRFQRGDSQATFDRGRCKGFQSVTLFSGPGPCLPTPLVRSLYYLIVWRPWRDSNTRPLPPQGSALSAELQGLNWRGGRDSNPRRLLHLNRLAGGPNRPLWHLPSMRFLRRRERDSNPRSLRLPVFKTGAIVHSAIPPAGESLPKCEKYSIPAGGRQSDNLRINVQSPGREVYL